MVVDTLCCDWYLYFFPAGEHNVVVQPRDIDQAWEELHERLWLHRSEIQIHMVPWIALHPEGIDRALELLNSRSSRRRAWANTRRKQVPDLCDLGS